MATFTKLAWLVAMIILAGCAPRPQQPAKPAATQSVVSRPVIIRLVGRHQTITVTKGQHGPLYSVTDATGRIVVAEMTLEQLRWTDPNLCRQVEQAIAPALDDDAPMRTRSAESSMKELEGASVPAAEIKVHDEVQPPPSSPPH